MIPRAGDTAAASFPALLFVGLLAVLVYANSLGNGFAYDDVGVVVENPTVTSGSAIGALSAPWWTAEAGGGRLHRPFTQAALALQWRWFDGQASGFHAVSVALHVGVSLLVALLCGMLAVSVGARGREERRWAALAGGSLFAVHPVHVEAVANVVGQAELWAALATVGAVLVHLRTREATGPARWAGTVGVGVLMAVALGAKEIGITLPALLLLVEGARARSVAALGRSLRRELPRILLVAGVAGFVLTMRVAVLGTLAGETPTAILAGLEPLGRLGRVLPLWTEYLRLFLWPVTLAADYDPGVVYPARGPSAAQVVVGAGVLVATAVAVVAGWRRAPLAALGAAWFVVAILPVSNLLIPTGSLLAERTLYLPSVGWALAVAAAAVAVRGELERRPAWSRRVAGTAAAAALVFLGARTLERNPSWSSSGTVMATLARDHPESWRAHLAGAQGLERLERHEEAAAAYRAAVDALPNRFSAVTAAGAYFKRRGDLAAARPFLERALHLDPTRPSAWVLVAEVELLEGRYRQAHRIAARGIEEARASGELWAVLSEAYVGGGLLDAALRARTASVNLDPTSARGWRRLAELLEAAGAEPHRVASAQRRATELAPASGLDDGR